MKSIGKIVYSPNTHLLSSKNWAILSCDDEIARYYRYLSNKQISNLKLVKPMWGAHISWIRNEIIPNKIWNLSNHKVIEYEYDIDIRNNSKFYWLQVKCDYLLELRAQYGLSKYPKFGLHLTIGRVIK